MRGVAQSEACVVGRVTVSHGHGTEDGKVMVSPHLCLRGTVFGPQEDHLAYGDLALHFQAI